MSVETTVKDLIQTLEDGRKGFADASDRLAEDGNAQLAGRFREFSDQRLRFAAELRETSRRAGVTTDDDGSLAGALHRGWIKLKDALTGDDPDAVVNAAVTGEDHAVSEFEKALDGELPAELDMVVKQQLTQIRAVRDELQAIGS